MVAARYGMLEDDWLHYWFPVYDSQYHQYSPGTAMFLEIANAAMVACIKKINLGYGEQSYKHKFVNTITEMPYGCISSCRMMYLKEQASRTVLTRVKHLPGKPILKRLLRSVWQSFGSSHFS